jgi:hypothetical protein
MHDVLISVILDLAEVSNMTCFHILLIGVAALSVLSASAAQSTPMTDQEKSTVYRLAIEKCVTDITRDAPRTPQLFSRPAFTTEEISDYCRCDAETLAEIVTSEEYNSGKGPIEENVKEDLREKVACVAVEKCKNHLNLPDPSQFQHARCWKG